MVNSCLKTLSLFFDICFIRCHILCENTSCPAESEHFMTIESVVGPELPFPLNVYFLLMQWHIRYNYFITATATIFYCTHRCQQADHHCNSVLTWAIFTFPVFRTKMANVQMTTKIQTTHLAEQLRAKALNLHRNLLNAPRLFLSRWLSWTALTTKHALR